MQRVAPVVGPVSLTPQPNLGGEPTPNGRGCGPSPLQRSEEASQQPGIRHKIDTPNGRAQPWGRRASRGAPGAGCSNWGGLQLVADSKPLKGPFGLLVRLGPQPRPA
eukprot:2818141-Alexandrium_andersonii.AAC.1